MSDECQQDQRSRLKYVLVNNLKYSEYISVVPRYLIDIYVYIYNVRCDI
jgi:hypothetical protein